MSIPALLILLCFLSKQAIEKRKRKHVPFTLNRKRNDLSLTLIERWLSTLLDILCKYLDKSTTGTFMKPADDFKWANAFSLSMTVGQAARLSTAPGRDRMQWRKCICEEGRRRCEYYNQSEMQTQSEWTGAPCKLAHQAHPGLSGQSVRHPGAGE